MSRPILGYLVVRGVQITCCGDLSQPFLVADELLPEWLCQHVDYYEEVEVYHRADGNFLTELKKRMPLWPECSATRFSRLSLKV